MSLFDADPTADGEWHRYDLRTRIVRFGLLLLTAVLLYASWRALNVRYDFALSAPAQLADLFARMVPPDVGYTGEIISPLIETIHIAILGTGLAIVLALPVAFLSAHNTTPNRLTHLLGKFIISFTRSVNVIIWALFFVVIFGPGALAGVASVAVRSIGFTAKLLGEAIEEIDFGQVEAVTATGASRLLVLVYAIVPQVKPAFVGIATYRWDINVRAATILGFVGAGGIGVELTTRIDTYDWRGVLTILLAILAVVIVSEVLSAYFRKKVS